MKLNIILREYYGDFEKEGKPLVGDHIREIYLRFREITDYDQYINSIDVDYDKEDSVFNGNIKNLDTTQVNNVSRSQYGKKVISNKITLKVLATFVLFLVVQFAL